MFCRGLPKFTATPVVVLCVFDGCLKLNEQNVPLLLFKQTGLVCGGSLSFSSFFSFCHCRCARGAAKRRFIGIIAQHPFCAGAAHCRTV
jgi:hypothetical protein